ncbi:MAG: prepilin peptidase [Archaeoglobaceae archaeon]|nr:prepilin peptidase [Archaeoglobaceae archaeon]MDW8118040.1 A24 family peptidase C-terminal domain-containing protein [Archaeoglobaceae archaeon]
MNWLELAKILIVFLFLIYACKLDLKSRLIPNRVWKFMLIVTIPITAFQVYLVAILSKALLLFAFFGILFMILLSYLLYRMGTYGGADAKALMCLAVIFPFYPDLEFFPIVNEGFGVFSFSVLANSVIFAPALMFGLFFRNVIKEGFSGFFKTPLYYIAGYRIEVDKIRFHNLFEFIDEKGELKRVRRGVEANEELIKRLKKSKIEKVWVTPALPFIIFITFGYAVAFLFGDILFLAISLIL